jgi:hypothetical protein
MAMRDHSPVIIDRFNGLWQRGDDENCPIDHWRDCNNIKFIGNNKFGTRDGVGISQTATGPLGDIVRIYNFPQPTGNTYIVLTYDGANGKIYHVVNATTMYGPLLTIAGMTDFAFVPYAGRAYISPFTTYAVNGLNVEKGMTGEFLYVYKGDGTAAFKAAGDAPTGTLGVANGAAGFTDAGAKVFGVVFEFDTGFLSAPGALVEFTTSSTNSVSFSSVPISASAHCVKRHIVASITIDNYDGNVTGYDLFFIPLATINDNTTTTLSDISFYDADLLEDASHLFDNYSEIPAGAALTLYHNRLMLAATYTDISLIIASAIGEPEAISQINGLMIVPPEGNPITNMNELRDVLYVNKRTKTGAFVDNGGEPATWQYSIIDNALGCPVHGVGTVLDSGSNNVDFFIVATYQGINLFNGKYQYPELTYKIDALWQGLDQNEFRKIQIVNNPLMKEFYIVLPTGILLVGNYSNGLDYKSIRWTKWSLSISINTIAMVNINDLVIGSNNS